MVFCALDLSRVFDTIRCDTIHTSKSFVPFISMFCIATATATPITITSSSSSKRLQIAAIFLISWYQFYHQIRNRRNQSVSLVCSRWTITRCEQRTAVASVFFFRLNQSHATIDVHSCVDIFLNEILSQRWTLHLLLLLKMFRTEWDYRHWTLGLKNRTFRVFLFPNVECYDAQYRRAHDVF